MFDPSREDGARYWATGKSDGDKARDDGSRVPGVPWQENEGEKQTTEFPTDVGERIGDRARQERNPMGPTIRYNGWVAGHQIKIDVI